MPKIDVVDEAIIDSKPSIVFNALLNEYEGAKNWWMPHWEAKPREGLPFRQVGGIVDITVHHGGTTRTAAKSIEIVPEKYLKEEFFEGDFLGYGEWTLEPVDDKKVKFRFNARTNRLLFTLASPFVNIARAHSEVMQKGFKALNNYLSKK